VGTWELFPIPVCKVDHFI